jgi:dihydroorotate dehydrogenase electron transfer subunit
MIQKEWMKVKAIEQVAEDIYELVLQGELIKAITAPGQFVHIKVGSGFTPLIRRPISIADVDLQANTITLLFRSEGKGTKLLATVKRGDTIDVLGPLGNGFPTNTLQAGDTALLVGGGIGVPPLYSLAKELVAKGIHVVSTLGFATKDVVFYEKKFAQLGECVVVTVDGSYGEKGFVTDGINKMGRDFHALFACGPTPMLKALSEKYPEKSGFLSLEERMGCGIGACFACVCHVDNGYRKICFQSGRLTCEKSSSEITRLIIKKSYYACFRLLWLWERVCKPLRLK